jgi:hypothetical protein
MSIIQTIQCKFGKHQWGEWEVLVGSCKQQRVCAHCQAQEFREQPHQWGEWEFLVGSCKQQRVCAHCQAQEFHEQPHQWEWKDVEDVCEQQRVCVRCGQVRETRQLPHTWDKGSRVCVRCKAKKKVVDLINLLLMHNNASERGKTALRLGEIGDARAVEPLIKALEDEDRKVHWQAAWALGEIGDARAVEPLIRKLEGKFPVDQDALRESSLALVKIGSHAVEPLIKVLREDADVLTRSLAAQILGQIGDARAVEPLTEALKDKEEHVQKAAEEALFRLELGEAH